MLQATTRAKKLPGLVKFGVKIRKAREAKKLGVRNTAATLGISHSYLTIIENCCRSTRPAEDIIQSMVRLLDLDFDELMHLAGKIPGKLVDYILSDLSILQFLRDAYTQKLTGADLQKLLANYKGGKRNVVTKLAQD